MNAIAIRVESLSKLYPLGQQHDSYRTLREALTKAARRPFQRMHSLIKDSRECRAVNNSVWALRDVSFEVKHGDVLGIIGRNGSGKSTLLKVLSRITEPTKGRVEGYGRVGSLLEVGTGFHPELTGRENIYLNGAVLGMRRAEINRKFDEIVAFAEVERFLDTPVKRYSSGMYVRLAFAVAAHLEPEILIVDEVLAVGDGTFQKKCLGKMGDVAREGRTVLFVSHNMSIVQALCKRIILLDQGTVLIDDTTTAGIAGYLRMLEKPESQDLLTRTDTGGRGPMRLTKIEVSTNESCPLHTLITGRSARFIFHVTEKRSNMACSFTIYNQLGQPVTYFDSTIHSKEDVVDPTNAEKFICELDELLLIPGRYRIEAGITHNGELQDHLEAAAFFDVEQGNVCGRPAPGETGYGDIVMKHRWTI